MTHSVTQLSKDYDRVQRAIQYLDENFLRQPNLKEVAKVSGISEFHFQRVFGRWAGISPKRFLQFLTKEYAKQLLHTSNLLDVSYDAGLSGPGRLHDLFISCEAMSPGEYKLKGQGLTIDYGFCYTRFGECFVALTERGICGLLFLDKANRKEVLKEFSADWQNAKFNLDQNKIKEYMEDIFDRQTLGTKRHSVKLLCRGTNFQIKVWEALLKIPSGQVVTYKTLARWMGYPQAARAAGNAVGKNPIAYLIPCHRVIRSVGHWGGYRWGSARKKAILGMEAAARLKG